MEGEKKRGGIIHDPIKPYWLSPPKRVCQILATKSKPNKGFTQGRHTINLGTSNILDLIFRRTSFDASLNFHIKANSKDIILPNSKQTPIGTSTCCCRKEFIFVDRQPKQHIRRTNLHRRLPDERTSSSTSTGISTNHCNVSNESTIEHPSCTVPISRLQEILCTHECFKSESSSSRISREVTVSVNTISRCRQDTKRLLDTITTDTSLFNQVRKVTSQF